MDNKPKPGITILKSVVTLIVTLVVIMGLQATFTSEPSGGFKNRATEAIPENGYMLIAAYLVIPVQLALHYYFTFKHWVIVNTIYYLSLICVLLGSIFVTFVAQL